MTVELWIRGWRKVWPLVLVFVLAAIAAVPVLIERHAVEQSNRTLELTADLQEFEQFALREGLDPDAVYAALAEVGVTSLALREMTPQRLSDLGEATVLSGGELLAAARSLMPLHPLLREVLATASINPIASYVLVSEQAVFDDLHREACRRSPLPCRVWTDGDSSLLEVPIATEKFLEMGIGIWSRDVETAARHGLGASLRFRDYPGAGPEQIDAAFAAVDAAWPGAGGRRPALTSVIFDETAVLGAGSPESTAALARNILARDLVVGPIESVDLRAHLPQQGLDELLVALDYRAARVYSIHPNYLAKLLPDDVLEIWLRSPQERNIRIIYLRPLLMQDTDEPPLPMTLRTIERLVTGLHEQGWQTGRPDVFQPFSPNAWQQVLLGFGAVGLGVLLVTMFVPIGPFGQVVLLAGGGGLTFLAAQVIGANAVRDLLGLLIAVTAPTIAVNYVLTRWTSRAPRPASLGGALAGAALDAVAAAAIALAGALLLAALLGDVRYLLELRFFRGVKVALLAPPLLVALLYFWRFGLAEPEFDGRSAAVRRRLLVRWQQLKALSADSVRWLHVGLGLIALVALVLFIARSGNVSREVVPQLELLIRALLENVFGVRPRFKEFIIGYPALMLAGWLLYRRLSGYVWAMGIAGAVGLASLLNSFQHLRTPVAVSLLRTVHGLWLGILFGLLGVFVIELIFHLGRKLFDRSRGVADHG